MRVFFLGTGAAEGIPALFCDCQICTEAKRRGGADKRTRSSILIDDVIKVDLPPDTLAHVHNYSCVNLARLQHLLFTHSHDDHFAVREIQYLSPNFAPRRKEPLQVWTTHEIIRKMLPEMAHFFEEAPLRFHPLVPFVEFVVGHLRVTPLTARHKKDELCLNFLIRDGDRTLLYASDTGWYDEQTWQFLEGAQINTSIIECGKGVSKSSYDGHMSVDEVLKMRDRLLLTGGLASDAQIYVTHISHTGLLLHDQMVHLLAPHGVQVAWDGLEIEV